MIQVSNKQTLEAKATGNMLQYFTHLIRRSGSLEKEMMLGKTSVCRQRDRRCWMEEIKELTKSKWTITESRARQKKIAKHSVQSDG